MFKIKWPKNRKSYIELVQFMTMDFEGKILDQNIQVVKSRYGEKGETTVQFNNNFFKLFSETPVSIKYSPNILWEELVETQKNDLCNKLIEYKNMKESVKLDGSKSFTDSNKNYCYRAINKFMYIYQYPKSLSFTAKELSMIARVDFGESILGKEWYIGKYEKEYDGWIAFKGGKDDLVGIAWSTDALISLIDEPFYSK